MFYICLVDVFIFAAIAAGTFAALRIVKAAEDNDDDLPQ